MPIKIMDKASAQAYVATPGTAGEVDYLVSILCPGDPPLHFDRKFQGEVLQLRFDDIEVSTGHASVWAGYKPVTEHQVAALIQFGRCAVYYGMAGGNIVFHCSAGISRSTAAALMALWPEHQLAAKSIVLRAQPLARPNLLMAKIADHAFCANGRFMQMVEDIHNAGRLAL